MKLLNVSYNILGSNINSSRFRVCVFTIYTVDHKYYGHIILPTSTRYNYCKTQTYFTLLSILYYEPRMMRMNLISTNRALTTKQLKKQKQSRYLQQYMYYVYRNRMNLCYNAIHNTGCYRTDDTNRKRRSYMKNRSKIQNDIFPYEALFSRKFIWKSVKYT